MNQDSFPFVSVIIPVYNRANYIKSCIDSVLNQDYPNLEIIVVDDGSTDETLEVLNKYGTHITVIKLPENSGAQATRNAGIKAAKHDWIAFLDSDDQWVHNKITVQIEELKKMDMDPWTVIHGDCYRLKNKSESRSYWELPYINGPDVHKDLLDHPSPMFQAMLTSKLALEKIGLLDEAIPAYQEWDTAISLSKHCQFIHIRQSLFFYSIREKDTISRNNWNSINGYDYIINKHRSDILVHCGTQVYNKHMIINAIQAMNCRLFKLAREILSRSIGISSKRIILYLLSWFQIKPKLLLKFYSKI
jgi:glycosyltransferase involved in cell wall biosynthesis